MKRLGVTLSLVLVIVLLLAGAGYVAMKRGLIGSGDIIKDSGENISDYSAVFLTNGQVYFGKVTSKNNLTVDLKDIYYLQVNQNLQQPDNKSTSSSSSNSTAQPNISLVKLGEELHGPNDLMRINQQQVLFTESMKKDSKVVKAIDDYKTKK